MTCWRSEQSTSEETRDASYEFLILAWIGSHYRPIGNRFSRSTSPDESNRAVLWLILPRSARCGGTHQERDQGTGQALRLEGKFRSIPSWQSATDKSSYDSGRRSTERATASAHSCRQGTTDPCRLLAKSSGYRSGRPAAFEPVRSAYRRRSGVYRFGSRGARIHLGDHSEPPGGGCSRRSPSIAVDLPGRTSTSPRSRSSRDGCRARALGGRYARC